MKTVFASKRKTTIEQFCRRFWDSQVFQPSPPDERVFSVLLDEVLSFIRTIDPSPRLPDRNVVLAELMALRIELWGLAFVRRLRSWEEIKRETERCEQSELLSAKRYLQEKGRLDIWEAMSAYNEAIGLTSAREHITELRDITCEHLMKTGMDQDCARRLANRQYAGNDWSHTDLCNVLLRRLHRQANLDTDSQANASTGLATIVDNLFTDAMKRLLLVEIDRKRCKVKSRSWASMKRLALGVFCLIACSFCYVIIASPLTELALIRHSVSAPGFITKAWEDVAEDIEGRVHWVNDAAYTYRLPDGREFTGRAHGSGRLPQGLAYLEHPYPIEVEYLPAHPSTSRVKGTGNDTVSSWLWRNAVLFALFVIAPSLCFFWRGSSERRRIWRAQRSLWFLSETVSVSSDPAGPQSPRSVV